MFAESSSSGRTLHGGAPPHLRSDASERSFILCAHYQLTGLDAASTVTAVPHGSESHIERPQVADPVDSPYLLVQIPVINTAQARENSTRQPRKHASMLSLLSFKSRPTELDASPQLDDGAKHKNRISRKLGKVLGPHK